MKAVLADSHSEEYKNTKDYPVPSSTAAIRQAYVDPVNPIFPVTYGSWPPCAFCFRQRRLDWTAIPSSAPDLIPVCHDCAVAVGAGQPVDLPAGEELTEVWGTLARLHNNGEIKDGVIDRALAACVPELPPPDGWEALEALKGALLRIQAAEDPCTVLDRDLTGPDHDGETYVNLWHGIADDMLAKLTGEAR